jgi:hypothetical protein
MKARIKKKIKSTGNTIEKKDTTIVRKVPSSLFSFCNMGSFETFLLSELATLHVP